LSFGACGAFAPLAGPSPAPAANAAGRVKSRRPDSVKIKPHIDSDVGLFSGVQLEVETASPVPGRRIYTSVHVQLLENVVYMVLHGGHLED